MKIAIVGASGFVGKRLVGKLLGETDYSVVAISLHPTKIKTNYTRLSLVKCDIFDTAKLAEVFKGCDIAFYLVHMMAKDYRDFPDLEAKAAKSFCVAAKKSDVKKVIYLGGLGDDTTKLSKHLRSRHNTGKILGSRLPIVYEFRASIIIGSGSSSFEMIKSMVDKTPIMLLPGWANTRIQPICADDAIDYLLGAIKIELPGHQIFEIGGPKTMTYKELLISYAGFINKNLKIIIISWLPRWPAKFWLKLFIDKKLYFVALAMIESLENDVVVKNRNTNNCFADISPKLIESEFK